MRFLALVAVLVGAAVPALAQAVCPDLQGPAALDCVASLYRPATVLSLDASKDRLYDTVDRVTVGGQDGTAGLYTGYFVPFDGQPSADPSQDVYNNDGSNGINQEHVFPRSRGTDGNYAERDLHHLFPTRAAVNSSRGNDPFGVIDDAAPSAWYRGGDRVTTTPADPEAWSQSAGGTFEPRAEVRGDVARAMFYVAAVYAAEVDGAWFRGQLDALLAWHEADPVSAYEAGRNGRVAQFQSGCGSGSCDNPFVVDPTLAGRAFAPGGGGNGAPALVADLATTDEDAPVVVDVLANDGDPDGDALVVVAVAAPAHGTATTDGATVTYAPAPDFSGTDTFGYTVSDGAAEAASTVRVTVRPVNDAPTAPVVTAPSDEATVEVAGEPDSDAVTFAWTASADAEGDQLAYRWELAETAAFDPVVVSAAAQGPSVRVTVRALADALDGLGVGLGESAALYHRAVADDGQAETAGAPARVTLVRGAVTAGEDGAGGPALSVSVRPNPAGAGATVSVEVASATAVRVAVYDALGRAVAVPVDGPLAAGQHDVPLDLSALPAGVYVIRVVSGAAVASRMVVVAR